MLAVGLHTCTAVARSLCVSWAFLFTFIANRRNGAVLLLIDGPTYRIIVQSVEEEFRLELGQNDNLGSTDKSCQHDDDLAVDVKERQNSDERIVAGPVVQRIARSTPIQYNILSLQSQTDRCESDIKYDSITNRQLPRRTVLWEILRLVTIGNILENTIYTIYTFAPIVI